MELANKAGARFTLLIGDDEMIAGRYALKNMASGDQQNLTRDEIFAVLAAAEGMRQFDMETSVSLDFLGDLRRTHMCGALRASDEGKNVILMGWVPPPPRPWRRHIRGSARP